MLIPPADLELFQADALLWLRARPAESVDLVVTDPPYESLEKHRKVGTTTRLAQSKGSSSEWFPVITNDVLAQVIVELYRVLRRDRHAYVVCDWETAWRCVAPAGEAAGFDVWTPIVWDKVAIGMGYHYRSRYEMVCFLTKGRKRRLADLGEPNVQRFKRVRGGYPTEKPQGLGYLLVRQSSQPGEIVLDPFMGSGVFGAAARNLDRRFVGVDVKDEAVRLARERIMGGDRGTADGAGSEDDREGCGSGDAGTATDGADLHG